MRDPPRPIRRRTALKRSVCLLATASGCIGNQNGEPTEADQPTETSVDTESPESTTSNDPEPALEAVEYFTVNTIGSRTGGDDPLYKYSYRAGVPFQMETDVGGVVPSRNHENGIGLEIDLIEDDGYGGAGIHSRVRRLEDITRIQFCADEALFVVLQLGIQYNDESIFVHEADVTSEMIRSARTRRDLRVETYDTEAELIQVVRRFVVTIMNRDRFGDLEYLA